MECDVINEQPEQYLRSVGTVFAEFGTVKNKEHKNKLLPGPIRQHAKEVDRLLAKITVCDPAIGSGAFPVGMMQEIVKARLTLADVEGMPARADEL